MLPVDLSLRVTNALTTKGVRPEWIKTYMVSTRPQTRINGAPNTHRGHRCKGFMRLFGDWA
jgi:hypothetical protein